MAAPNSSLLLPALLSPVDGAVFAGFLLLAAAVALTFALLGHKSPTHFFLGGRQMRPVPVGISAGVSALPAAAFLRFSDEAFARGCGVALAPFSGALSFFLVSAFVIEVLRPLRMDSLGAYFMARFRSRSFVHFANFLSLACVLPTVAFYQHDALRVLLTWTDGHLNGVSVIVLLSLLLISCATAGGFRSVVWAEALMAVVLLAGGLMIIFQSVVDTPGGMATILRLNMDYGHFRMPPLIFDPHAGHSLFALTVAVFISSGLVAAQPANVQRLCCTATRREAYLVATTAAATSFAFAILLLWAGINIFGYFAHTGCSVLGSIPTSDVLVAYTEQAVRWPGCKGLVLSAVFVGAMCYFSSGINAAAAVLWKDFLSPSYFRHAAHRSALLVSRLLSFGCGLVAMAAAFIFFFTPPIQQLDSTYIAALWAPYLAILLVVATFRRAHPLGMAFGVVIAAALTFWLGIVSSTCPRSPMPDPVCSGNSSLRLSPAKRENVSMEADPAAPAWTCISPLWLAPLSFSLTVALSFGASLCCCCCRKPRRRRRRLSSRVGDEAMSRRQGSDCLYVSLSTIEH